MNLDPLQLAAADDDLTLKTLLSDHLSALTATSLWYSSRQKTLLHRTPLTIAATYASLRVLHLLLSSPTISSTVNLPVGDDLTTPLHCAAASAHPSAPAAIHLLLSHGADPSLPNAAGHLPADSILLSPATAHLKPLLLKQLNGNSSDDKEEEKNKISNGVYNSDEFRMFSFKVRPCSRAYSHDWTDCPFVHPGENARRRDPRKYHYSCVPCPDFRKGACRRGDSCEYAHGVFECWLHPAQYRTRLCKDGFNCERRVCFFAHTADELRPLYMSTGSAVPSPRSMDMLPAWTPQQQQSTPPPMLHLPNVAVAATATATARLRTSVRELCLSPRYGFGLGFGGQSPSRVSQPVVSSWSSSSWSNWGTPTGKLDWGVNGEELGSFRRQLLTVESDGFGLSVDDEEPDVSWVHSLVNPPPESMQDAVDGDGNRQLEEHAVLGAWLEQMQLDQLVA